MTAADMLYALQARRTTRAAQIAYLREEERNDIDRTMKEIAAHLTTITGQKWRGMPRWLLCEDVGPWNLWLLIGPKRVRVEMTRQGRFTRLSTYPTIEAAAKAAIKAAQETP